MLQPQVVVEVFVVTDGSPAAADDVVTLVFVDVVEVEDDWETVVFVDVVVVDEIEDEVVLEVEVPAPTATHAPPGLLRLKPASQGAVQTTDGTEFEST